MLRRESPRSRDREDCRRWRSRPPIAPRRRREALKKRPRNRRFRDSGTRADCPRGGTAALPTFPVAINIRERTRPRRRVGGRRERIMKGPKPRPREWSWWYLLFLV